ncbi:PAS/PAC sensor signal transduction histidine kinase [Colwellia chukchiensis]|uniref:Sensory histidine kinase/phosphatase NtrB n=1 Tax=Colwellia chukchiensis TaxID=641665 RepID=A0A1H7RGF0_9GAMM|nr:nitrogen regulation protein NR(II) [Colwellia chukchiensis]SEL59185.1 PAS/PAC sensor signal transduction histidine kinase [Colwellia chukchiensis]
MANHRVNLKQIKLHYQHALPNQMVTAVVVLDHNLRICYVNPAAEALLVKSFNKLYRLTIAQVFYNTPINTRRLEQLLTTGQEFSDSDVTIEFFDHRQITVEITASSVTFEQCPHILLEFKQIDQQKQISDEAFQQQQWESARDLIRGLAHEIKNPLGGLRGAAQLLDKELNIEQREYTAMIIEQADRLTDLVDRLLGPNQLPIMKTQNIHIVLEKVFKLTQFDNPKNITLVRDYDPSIPEITFDQDKLQQTLINIVHNAMQVLQNQHSITLKTRAANNKTINGKRIKLCAQISIIDDGPGIPEHIQSTLFYPMVSGRAAGTGLGLSICQTIIHQHQGKLYCKSRPGRTEFTILLPFNSEN